MKKEKNVKGKTVAAAYADSREFFLVIRENLRNPWQKSFQQAAVPSETGEPEKQNLAFIEPILFISIDRR